MREVPIDGRTEEERQLGVCLVAVFGVSLTVNQGCPGVFLGRGSYQLSYHRWSSGSHAS